MVQNQLKTMIRVDVRNSEIKALTDSNIRAELLGFSISKRYINFSKRPNKHFHHQLAVRSVLTQSCKSKR